MKKLFLSLSFMLVAFAANAQFTPNLVVTAGLPVGDYKDASSFALSADLYFMKSVSESFGLGVTSGYSIYFGKDYDEGLVEIEGANFSYLPLAGAFRFNLSEDFSIGTDVGYAFGLSDNTDGGFYYKPTLGFNIGDSSQLILSYQGISEDGGTLNYIGLGFAFGM
ncbi:hypothetical protein [uncultured Polaribacter sp.]|uniref:hypothetical protein n=1 Tax=uncultured Polaribacter sp. TaxID=174711 RepID=UPI0026141DC5|nr:hypothetical protein [uncultured Polaribacter sp.]